MKKTMRFLLGMLSLLLIAAAMWGLCSCGAEGGDGTTSPSSTAGSTPEDAKKSVTVTLVDDKGGSKDYTVKTEAATLRAVLEECGLVTKEEPSFLTTVGGITVDWGRDESWWKLSLGETPLMVGASDQPVKDGEHYYVVYTRGM